MKIHLFVIVISALLTTNSFASSNENTTIQSFNKAKKLLERNVYHNHRETLYCGATFSKSGKPLEQ